MQSKITAEFSFNKSFKATFMGHEAVRVAANFSKNKKLCFLEGITKKVTLGSGTKISLACHIHSGLDYIFLPPNPLVIISISYYDPHVLTKINKIYEKIKCKSTTIYLVCIEPTKMQEEVFTAVKYFAVQYNIKLFDKVKNKDNIVQCDALVDAIISRLNHLENKFFAQLFSKGLFLGACEHALDAYSKLNFGWEKYLKAKAKERLPQNVKDTNYLIKLYEFLTKDSGLTNLKSLKYLVTSNLLNHVAKNDEEASKMVGDLILTLKPHPCRVSLEKLTHFSLFAKNQALPQDVVKVVASTYIKIQGN